MEIFRLGPDEETDGLPPDEFARVLEGLVGPDRHRFAALLSKETLTRFFDTPITTPREALIVLGLLGELEVWEVEQQFGTVERCFTVNLGEEDKQG